MKYELIEWLCMKLTLAWFIGSNLGGTKLNFLFANFSFGMNMKGQRNPSSKKSNLGG